MSNLKPIHDFAVKWSEKFGEKTLQYNELMNQELTGDCKTLGFVINDYYFNSEKDGDIDNITDCQLLGSIIYSKWHCLIQSPNDDISILEPEKESGS